MGCQIAEGLHSLDARRRLIDQARGLANRSQHRRTSVLVKRDAPITKALPEGVEQPQVADPSVSRSRLSDRGASSLAGGDLYTGVDGPGYQPARS